MADKKVFAADFKPENLFLGEDGKIHFLEADLLVDIENHRKADIRSWNGGPTDPVSYTHLTLPTKA